MGTILITDDDEACRDTIQRTLEREGYRVEGASGVDEAIGAMRERDFDLVVCDYRMPGKNGLDLLAELRDRGSQIPVLMISACMDARTETSVELLGAVGLLRKPFRRQDLLSSVGEILGAGAK